VIAGTDDRSVLVDLAALLRWPGTRREVHVALVPERIETSVAAVVGLNGVVVAESVGEKVAVSGTLALHWRGECRRCLEPATGTTDVEIQEIFEKDPVEGETYALPAADHLDLAPMLLEQAILALPLAPLCDESCAGPAPEVYPAAVAAEIELGDEGARPVGDPRWAALDALRLDGPEDSEK
jgi:uncharacterized protein